MKRVQLLLILAASTASSAAFADSDALLTLESRGHMAQVEVSPSSYGGELMDLHRSDRRLEGNHLGRELKATLGDRLVEGSVGGKTIHLELGREDQATSVHGLYQGQETALRIDEQRLSGNVGPCTYDLKKSEGRYRGTSSCGSAPAETTLVVPEMLLEKPESERLLALCLVLGRAVGPQGRSYFRPVHGAPGGGLHMGHGGSFAGGSPAHASGGRSSGSHGGHR